MAKRNELLNFSIKILPEHVDAFNFVTLQFSTRIVDPAMFAYSI